jgi:hypothetical protein
MGFLLMSGTASIDAGDRRRATAADPPGIDVIASSNFS